MHQAVVTVLSPLSLKVQLPTIFAGRRAPFFCYFSFQATEGKKSSPGEHLKPAIHTTHRPRLPPANLLPQKSLSNDIAQNQ